LSSSAEIIVQFNHEERRHTLNPDVPYGIGRSPQNAICLPSDTVSRNHALIKQNDHGTFCVYDLGSRNGTLLNDRLVSSPMPLHDGDMIRVGEVVLSFAQKTFGAAEPEASFNPESATVVTFAMAQLTVLVADIRDFTSLSRQLGPGRIAELVHAYNSAAGSILDRSGAWTMKFIGDAVMAVWLCKAEEPPVKTVFTAFDAFEKIYHFVASLQEHFNLSNPVSIGGGINTGYATVGNLGSGSNADYTALGDSVNMAFRLEAATRGLNCDLTYGPNVEVLLRNTVDASLIGTATNTCLKGYAEECEVYAMHIPGVRRLLAEVGRAAGYQTTIGY
jgi:adenylate cyclase